MEIKWLQMTMAAHVFATSHLHKPKNNPQLFAAPTACSASHMTLPLIFLSEWTQHSYSDTLQEFNGIGMLLTLPQPEYW